MPELANARHELFAQELAKGAKVGAAYVAAGFKAHPSNPSYLAKNKLVVARISELLAGRAKIDAEASHIAAEALAIDKQWIMGRLKENAERALQAVPVMVEGEPTGEYRYEGSVANRALELLGKELGMFIEKSEVRTGPLSVLDEMSHDELSRIAAAIDAERTERPRSVGGPAPSSKPH